MQDATLYKVEVPQLIAQFSLIGFEAKLKEMSSLSSGLVLLAICVCVQAAGKCSAAFKPPDECFSADYLKELASTSTSIESMYNKYVNLLTDAKLTIDGDEVSCNAFFLKHKADKLTFEAGSKSVFWWRIGSKSQAVEISRELDHNFFGACLAS